MTKRIIEETRAGRGDAWGVGPSRPNARRTAATFVLLALAGGAVAGCGLDPPTGPGPTGPAAACGDGICAASESAATCAVDCAVPSRCGDGICAPGETCASCPGDCEAFCPAACQAIDVRTSLPEDLQDSTSSDLAAADVATCGDGAVGPLRRYRFTDLPPGRYRVSASATFDVVVDARLSDCGGPELACQVAVTGAVATFTLSLPSPRTIIVGVAGLAGAAGAFNLQLTPEPVCGDLICQDETCSSCPSDCGACVPPSQAVCGDGVCDAAEWCGSCPDDCGRCANVCGDGFCDATEDCTSCWFDCGTCGPTCGDGSCDAGEDCSSCPSDCGTCSDPSPPSDPFPPPDPILPPDPVSPPDPWCQSVQTGRTVTTPRAHDR